MAKLGYVKQIAGKDMDIYVTNLSYNELVVQSLADVNILPTNSLVICAYNKSTSTAVSDDESYRIAAIDYEGNVCPLTLFEEIGKGLETKVSNNKSVLSIKLGNGLLFDSDGNITLKLASSSGLLLTANGLAISK